MRIELRVERSPEGRLIGLAEVADVADEVVAFSGSMELLAAIERLCPPAPATAR